MTDERERAARMLLCAVSEPGDPVLAAHVAAEGACAVAASLTGPRAETPWGRRARGIHPADLAGRTMACGARFVVPGDAEWPSRLGDLAGLEHDRRGGEPIGLWLRGRGRLPELLGERPLAMVGSRAATGYGQEVARQWAGDLAEAGHGIVSGGAFGIDAAAHAGAMAVGRTVAVLACGVDRPYPRGNARIFDAILADHVLVSEVAPGETPSRLRFLGRNRLIAALGLGTLVVEAAVRSGARSTATWATLLGRHLMAAPGPVFSAQAHTPHELVRRREAELVASPAHIREMLAPMGEEMLPLERGRDRVLDVLDPQVREVFETLPGRGGRSASEIALRSGVAIGPVLAALDELSEMGLAEMTDSALWRLVPGSVG
ncbi:DNA-processing protein DprA [Mariniluteicoccus endophyticus]